MSNNHEHDSHSGHGHGHGSGVAAADMIPEKSLQDWLLVGVALAAGLSLLWYGFQWSMSAAEGPSTGGSTAPQHEH